MELLCDIDDWLMMANSICGKVSVNGIDLILLSMIRQFMDLDTCDIENSLQHIAPQIKPLRNLERHLKHLC